MTKVSRVLLAAFACVAFSATSFAGGPFGIIRVGKWQGAAYTTDKGAFSHCTAVAKFDNGLSSLRKTPIALGSSGSVIRPGSCAIANP